MGYNQVEQDLLNLLPVWEEANGRPFMVQGERVVDKIHDALEAKEIAKEAKKVSSALKAHDKLGTELTILSASGWV